MRRPDFDGSDYDRRFDVTRLTNQLEQIKAVMADGQWYTHEEIARVTGAPGASIGAQLANLRKKRYGAYPVLKRSRGDRRDGLWEYQLGDRGGWVPRKPAVLVRALRAEDFAARLADELEKFDPDNRVLAEYDRAKQDGPP